jgi:hypothetical protein
MKIYSPKEEVDACIVGGALGGVMARIIAEGGLAEHGSAVLDLHQM